MLNCSSARRLPQKALPGLDKMLCRARWEVADLSDRWGLADRHLQRSLRGRRLHGAQDRGRKGPLKISLATPQLGPPVAIEGFREARFGMNDEQVRQAIHKDFPAATGKVASAIHPSEKTIVLSVTVTDLLPHTGNARISYNLGYRSKNSARSLSSGRVTAAPAATRPSSAQRTRCATFSLPRISSRRTLLPTIGWRRTRSWYFVSRRDPSCSCLVARPLPPVPWKRKRQNRRRSPSICHTSRTPRTLISSASAKVSSDRPARRLKSGKPGGRR